MSPRTIQRTPRSVTQLPVHHLIERFADVLHAHQLAAGRRLVARDVFLDGNTFRRGGPRVDRRPIVADWQVGVAINFHRWKITYSQAARTKEFYGQQRRQVFGSISITYSRPLQ